MDKDRFVISDDLWKKIAPLLPGKAGDPGATCAYRRIRPVIPTTSGHLNRGIRPLMARRVEA